MNTLELQEKLKRQQSYLAQDSNNWNLLLSISECYHHLDDVVSAQRYLDDAKKLSGQKFWAYQGLLYLEKREFIPAKEAFTIALTEQNSHSNRYYLALCLYLNHQFEEALAMINTSDTNENTHDSEFLKAKIFHHLQQPKKSILILSQLNTLSPSDDQVSGLLALLYFDDNNLELAEKHCRDALEQNADNSKAVLVNILLKTLKNTATIAEIELRLTKTPQETRLWLALGTTQLRLMNITAAETAFLTATQIWPDFYECWTNLAWCYVLQNNIDLAKNVYQKIIEIDAERADGWGGLALVSAMQEDISTAQALLEKAKAIDENCFLVNITEIIIGNQVNSDDAFKQLKKAFPEVSAEINRILSEAVRMEDPKNKIIH